MICPACGKDALIVEYANIELDYCPACRGVWFDAGELEMLLEAAGLENERNFLESVAVRPETEIAENKRRCPECRRKMKKVAIDDEGKIITDICMSGHGIWFDGGEVNALVKALAEKSPDKAASKHVLEFIGEMFKY
jgi:Zn-finger nucleic acid-binding protein